MDHLWTIYGESMILVGGFKHSEKYERQLG